MCQPTNHLPILTLFTNFASCLSKSEGATLLSFSLPPHLSFRNYPNISFRKPLTTGPWPLRPLFLKSRKGTRFLPLFVLPIRTLNHSIQCRWPRLFPFAKLPSPPHPDYQMLGCLLTLAKVTLPIRTYFRTDFPSGVWNVVRKIQAESALTILFFFFVGFFSFFLVFVSLNWLHLP